MVEMTSTRVKFAKHSQPALTPSHLQNRVLLDAVSVCVSRFGVHGWLILGASDLALHSRLGNTLLIAGWEMQMGRPEPQRA